MMSDEEHRAANSGHGLEIAESRMEAVKTESDAVTAIDHVLAAIAALSLHLEHVEAVADRFQREMQNKDVPRLPRVGANDLVDH